MSKIKIAIDSPGDLSLEIAEKNGISIIPIKFSLENEEEYTKIKEDFNKLHYNEKMTLEDSKVYFDLVSKIIIDERVLETQESKKLIELCKQKKWNVLIKRV